MNRGEDSSYMRRLKLLNRRWQYIDTLICRQALRPEFIRRLGTQQTFASHQDEPKRHVRARSVNFVLKLLNEFIGLNGLRRFDKHAQQPASVVIH
jgi:hypothetical protein